MTTPTTLSPAILRDRAPDQLGWMMSRIQSLVKMETPSSDPSSFAPMFTLLRRELESLGFTSSFLAGTGFQGGLLHARPRGADPSAPIQVLLGHADTVWPVGTLERMPFRLEEGRLHGPGIFDMKAGIVQMLGATRLLRDLDLRWSVTPHILINTDEEVGSHGSRMEIERLAEAADRVYVMEPALGLEGKLKTRRKAGGRFDVLVRGRSAHAGLAPGEGASAIVELSHVIQRLNALNDLDRGITVNVGQVNGGMAANVVAPTCTASVDVRVPTKQDVDDITRAIKAIRASTPGTEVVIEGHFGRPPLEMTPRNACLRDEAFRLMEAMGIKCAEGLAGGGSDGSYTSLHAATLDGLGPVGDGAHAEHEYVVVEHIPERTALLAGLIMVPPLGVEGPS